MLSMELLNNNNKKLWGKTLYSDGLIGHSRFSLALSEGSVVQQAGKTDDHNDKILSKWDVSCLTNSFW